MFYITKSIILLLCLFIALFMLSGCSIDKEIAIKLAKEQIQEDTIADKECQELAKYLLTKKSRTYRNQYGLACVINEDRYLTSKEVIIMLQAIEWYVRVNKEKLCN